MPIVPVPLAGQLGLSLDKAPAEIPPNAWSYGYNARFYEGAVRAMLGDKEILKTTAEGQPIYAIPSVGLTALSAVWTVVIGHKAYSLTNLTLTDITPDPEPIGFDPTEQLLWTGCNLGLQTLLNDTLRNPWYWERPDVLTPMIELPNWPDGMKCGALRSFKQFLVAVDITKADGNHYPQMVKWSHPADPGTPPITWDETDETKDAGETVLAETPGACIDVVSLRDTAVIYKTDSVWGMQYIGGVFIFRFVKIFGDWGIPHRHCAIEYSPGQHFCFTGNDLVVHDGNSARSVATGKIKSVLRAITVDQLSTCFVVAHPAFSEVWFCYRRQQDSIQAADTAIVFNYLDNTIGVRLLPNYRYIGTGRVDPIATQDETWDGNAAVWDAEEVAWLETSQIPAVARLLGLGEKNLVWIEALKVLHSPFFLERTYVGVPLRADRPPDMSTMKFIRRVWPRFTGQQGSIIKVTFGSADSVSEPIKWRSPMTLVLGVTRKFDITLSGKVIAIRIEAVTPPVAGIVQARRPADQPLDSRDSTVPLEPQVIWQFDGLDIDIKAAGEM